MKLITKGNNNFMLHEVGEIGLTLLAYESNYLYKALGMATLSTDISSVMETVEILNHHSNNNIHTSSYLEKIGEKKVYDLTSKIKDSYYPLHGNPRNEIKLNFKKVKKLCLEEGYYNPVVPLLVSVMIVRGL
ncbi:hypothetical protein [Priestia sp. P5]|uniref:hypothetical protein n=1 Tax=Priestia sp. P5 TaxID=2917806 RepID=UPI002404E5DF|nr:hypothetical protein [Priestia sp. P5]MDG0059146.1 hypothetical protein [Priestia sp. P5]